MCIFLTSKQAARVCKYIILSWAHLEKCFPLFRCTKVDLVIFEWLSERNQLRISKVQNKSLRLVKQTIVDLLLIHLLNDSLNNLPDRVTLWQIDIHCGLHLMSLVSDEAICHFKLEILVKCLPPRLYCVGLFFVVLLVRVLELLPVFFLDPFFSVAIHMGRHFVRFSNIHPFIGIAATL